MPQVKLSTAELLGLYRKVKIYFKSFLIGCLKSYIWKRERNVKKLLLLMTPNHNNIGDTAIAMGTVKFLRDSFPDTLLCEFYDRELKTHWSAIKYITRPDDVVCIHGGGNMGDLYPAYENMRQKLVKSFSGNPLVSMPQTIFYSNSPQGMKLLNAAKEVYSSHHDMTLLCRDVFSYHFASREFASCNNILFPDMALYLSGYEGIWPREGRVLLCLRNDRERSLSHERREVIVSACNRLCGGYTPFDTVAPFEIGRESRLKMVEDTLALYRNHRVCVTDRFHGMLFAYLTATPCIALKTINHKLVEGARWFQDCNFIFLANDVQEVPELLEKALNLREIKKTDFGEYFSALRDLLANRLKIAVSPRSGASVMPGVTHCQPGEHDLVATERGKNEMGAGITTSD